MADKPPLRVAPRPVKPAVKVPLKPAAKLLPKVPPNAAKPPDRANPPLAAAPAALAAPVKPKALAAAPAMGLTTADTTGRSTMVLKVLTMVSRRLSTNPLPDSKPRNRASVMDFSIWSAALLDSLTRSSAAFLFASRLSFRPMACAICSRFFISSSRASSTPRLALLAIADAWASRSRASSTSETAWAKAMFFSAARVSAASSSRYFCSVSPALLADFSAASMLLIWAFT